MVQYNKGVNGSSSSSSSRRNKNINLPNKTLKFENRSTEIPVEHDTTTKTYDNGKHIHFEFYFLGLICGTIVAVIWFVALATRRRQQSVWRTPPEEEENKKPIVTANIRAYVLGVILFVLIDFSMLLIVWVSSSSSRRRYQIWTASWFRVCTIGWYILTGNGCGMFLCLAMIEWLLGVTVHSFLSICTIGASHLAFLLALICYHPRVLQQENNGDWCNDDADDNDNDVMVGTIAGRCGRIVLDV